MIRQNLISILVIFIATTAIAEADEECTPQIKKTKTFAFEISPAEPSHDYDPILDMTTFYFTASRDLKPDEYFFISDDGCDYLTIVNETDFTSYENYVDELHCTKGRKIWPIGGLEKRF
ncbi:uncharacterized protein LOC142356974 [Convolutriloba macropyga]|uniref:uncharacterized protein LOC142356974 n=1 Tax=Convolutriloba macropyga TaxID=536237 RepID=UPI003F526467